MQKSQLVVIISLVFAVLVTVFAITNAGPVNINLFFYNFEASQALIIFLSAALGAITVSFLGIANHHKLMSEIKSLRMENSEIKSLRLENRELLEKNQSLTNALYIEPVNKDKNENASEDSDHQDKISN
ncbi:MAG: LapA family protein [Acetobacterium sp.]